MARNAPARRSTPASRSSFPITITASRIINATEVFSIASASHGGGSSASSQAINRLRFADSPSFAYCSSQRRNRCHRLSSIFASTSTSASRASSPSKSSENFSGVAGWRSNPAAKDCRSRSPSILVASNSTESVFPTFNDGASCSANWGQRLLRLNLREPGCPSASESSPSSVRQARIRSPGRPSRRAVAPTSDAANARVAARAR